MYLYFDKKGTLRETINDLPLRTGSVNWNKIYVYFEDISDSIIDAHIEYYKEDGTKTIQLDYDQRLIPNEHIGEKTCEVPWDNRRDLKFFQYFTPYEFFVFDVPQDALDVGGLVVADIELTFQDEEENQATIQLQRVPFQVEEGLGVLSEVPITESQYNYLLGQLGKFLKKTGDSMLGNLNVNEYNVSNVNNISILGNITDGTYTTSVEDIVKSQTDTYTPLITIKASQYENEYTIQLEEEQALQFEQFTHLKLQGIVGFELCIIKKDTETVGDVIYFSNVYYYNGVRNRCYEYNKTTKKLLIIDYLVSNVINVISIEGNSKEVVDYNVNIALSDFGITFEDIEIGGE